MNEPRFFPRLGGRRARNRIRRRAVVARRRQYTTGEPYQTTQGIVSRCIVARPRAVAVVKLAQRRFHQIVTVQNIAVLVVTVLVVIPFFLSTQKLEPFCLRSFCKTNPTTWEMPFSKKEPSGIRCSAPIQNEPNSLPTGPLHLASNSRRAQGNPGSINPGKNKANCANSGNIRRVGAITR
jgi:hypothetical protein